MRFTEYAGQQHEFQAVVRVTNKGTAVAVATSVHAGSLAHARLLLAHLFGAGNVLQVSERITEQQPSPADPMAAQAQRMQDQAKRLSQQAKVVKAQGALRRAQAQASSV